MLLHLCLTITQDLLYIHEGVRSYVKNLASRKTEECPLINNPGTPQGPLDGTQGSSTSLLSTLFRYQAFKCPQLNCELTKKKPNSTSQKIRDRKQKSQNFESKAGFDELKNTRSKAKMSKFRSRTTELMCKR